MMQQGGYDAHLARLRGQLKQQQSAALDAVRRHFPAGYRVARPAGGYFLWIECAADVDSLDVHRRALAMGISIAPRPDFFGSTAIPQFHPHQLRTSVDDGNGPGDSAFGGSPAALLTVFGGRGHAAYRIGGPWRVRCELTIGVSCRTK